MIESMIQTILDPFNAYGNPKDQEEGHIFSILPPLALAHSPAPSASQRHPAHGLARTRTTTTNSIVSNSTVNGGLEDASPASTARWAEEQKRRIGNGHTDTDATPKRRIKDQLSWIAERDDVPEQEADFVQTDQASITSQRGDWSKDNDETHPTEPWE